MARNLVFICSRQYIKWNRVNEMSCYCFYYPIQDILSEGISAAFCYNEIAPQYYFKCVFIPYCFCYYVMLIVLCVLFHGKL